MHLSFTPYVPTPVSPYAGHQYYFSFLSAVAANREIVVVAPRTDENEHACASGERSFEVRLTDNLRVAHSVVAGLRRRAGIRRLGETLSLPSIDSDIRRLCQQASSFELQWSESLVLAEALREFRRPMFATEHDLLWTTIVKAEGWLGVVSPRAPIRRRLVCRAEIVALNRCDMVVVFKNADVLALRSNGYLGETLVASPTLPIPTGELIPQSPPNILFVGAFSRRENYEGARWFINDVLPRIRAVGAPVRVTFAGAGMGPDLVALASKNGIETTGFVPDLDPVYRRATIAIAPIHRVGGLRFKVPQAMKYGLPVVGTVEALRGLEEAPAGSLVPPCDRPEQFAETILMLLQDEGRRLAQGKAGKEWVDDHFSPERTFDEIGRWIDAAEVRFARQTGRCHN